jgi:hypothetical protein
MATPQLTDLQAFAEEVYKAGAAGVHRTGVLPDGGYQITPQHNHWAYGTGVPQPPAITDAEKFCEQTVAELARAKEILIERGWVQGMLMSPDGYCLLGSVDAATGSHSHRAQVVREVLEEFLRHDDKIRSSASGVAGWNDHPQRTQAEVLDALHRAALWVKGKISDGE